MKTIAKLALAAVTLAALGAGAAHTIHAQVIAPLAVTRASAATGAERSKSYVDWQGPLTQSFGARFLAQGAPWTPAAGGTSGYGLTPQMFDGLDKLQTWCGPDQQRAL
ncbi:MAG TPA: hypothetical protein VH934_16235 [Xanthobacteraceae bacterium]|jgi:hypothetical protein